MTSEIEPERDKEPELDSERISLQTVMQVIHEPPVKRVVPRSVYVRIQAWKAGLRLSGLGYGVLAGLCGLLIVYFLYSLVTSLTFNAGSASWEGIGVAVLSCLVGIGVAAMEIGNCQESGAERLEQARRITPVTPLTRANTGHLPAKESLVRPSSEADRETGSMLRPASVHDAVPAPHMLRPVAAQPDTLPVEQLIRPATSPGEAGSRADH